MEVYSPVPRYVVAGGASSAFSHEFLIFLKEATSPTHPPLFNRPVHTHFPSAIKTVSVQLTVYAVASSSFA